MLYNVGVLRAYSDQCIHGQNIHAVTGAAMLYNVGVSRAYGDQCSHAQTTITFVFRERTCLERMQLPVHPCPNHNNVRVPGGPRAYGYQCIRSPTIIAFAFRKHTGIQSPLHPYPSHNSVGAPPLTHPALSTLPSQPSYPPPCPPFPPLGEGLEGTPSRFRETLWKVKNQAAARAAVMWNRSTD